MARVSKTTANMVVIINWVSLWVETLLSIFLLAYSLGYADSAVEYISALLKDSVDTDGSAKQLMELEIKLTKMKSDVLFEYGTGVLASFLITLSLNILLTVAVVKRDVVKMDCWIVLTVVTFIGYFLYTIFESFNEDTGIFSAKAILLQGVDFIWTTLSVVAIRFHRDMLKISRRPLNKPGPAAAAGNEDVNSAFSYEELKKDWEQFPSVEKV